MNSFEYKFQDVIILRHKVITSLIHWTTSSIPGTIIIAPRNHTRREIREEKGQGKRKRRALYILSRVLMEASRA
jgi:hypothetical protein